MLFLHVKGVCVCVWLYFLVRYPSKLWFLLWTFLFLYILYLPRFISFPSHFWIPGRKFQSWTTWAVPRPGRASKGTSFPPTTIIKRFCNILFDVIALTELYLFLSTSFFKKKGVHHLLNLDACQMGKLKKRIRPSDITINIGKDAPIPDCPIPGERWCFIFFHPNMGGILF